MADEQPIVMILRLCVGQRCTECTQAQCAEVKFTGNEDRRILCWACIHRFCAVLDSLRKKS